MGRFGLGCFIAAASLLQSCANTPIAARDAAPVPAERIYRQLSTPSTDDVLTVFVRGTGFTGSGVYYHLFVDGAQAASLNPGEKVEFRLTPGEHTFGVRPTDPFGNSALNVIDQDLKAGKSYVYQLVLEGDSMRVSIQRSIVKE